MSDTPMFDDLRRAFTHGEPHETPLLHAAFDRGIRAWLETKIDVEDLIAEATARYTRKDEVLTAQLRQAFMAGADYTMLKYTETEED